jgi:hypothetical protein
LRSRLVSEIDWLVSLPLRGSYRQYTNLGV